MSDKNVLRRLVGATTSETQREELWAELDGIEATRDDNGILRDGDGNRIVYDGAGTLTVYDNDGNVVESSAETEDDTAPADGEYETVGE